MRSKLRRALFITTIIATLLYIGWRTLFTLPLEFGFVSIAAGLFLLISEFLSALQALDKYGGLSYKDDPELPAIPDSWYPDMDVLITTHNESRDLLYKTVNACTYLNYPDKSKIHIYICDDNDRPEIAELAVELNVGYFGLSGNKLAKAGNLNNALSKTFSPLIISFDADMIPAREILIKTVPYFFLPRVKKNEDGTWREREPGEIDPDYKIGFIQTPQSFYNADLFQFYLYSENRIPNEQDYFFREVNANRNSANAPIYAGTNTILSRKALEGAGYIATGTITEDFATGINIQRKGWTTIATTKPLAHGLAPDSIDNLLNQRERWGRGCIQSLSKVKLLFVKDLSFKTKLSYMNCYFYWWTFLARLIFIMAPILFAVFRLRIVICSWWQIIVFWLPYYLLYGITLRLSSRETRNQHWNSVIDTIIFPYLAGPVLWESLGIRLHKFITTRKDKSNDTDPTWPYALPHILLFLTSIIALVLMIPETLKSASVNNLIIIFWLVVNCKNLLLSIIFMWGRRNVRRNTRFYVKLPVKVHVDDSVIQGQTLDISENGMAIELHWPEYIAPDTEFTVTVNDAPYEATMVAKILHVEQKEDKWKYCCLITNIDNANLRQYSQIIYDRHHSMPDKIAENWSMFDDYSLNLSKRTEIIMSVQRRLPRIEMGIPLGFESGGSGELVNFNYQYFNVRYPLPVDAAFPGAYLDSFDISVSTRPDLIFRLKYVSSNIEKRTGLYFITNRLELLNSEGFRDLVGEWVIKMPMTASTFNEVYLQNENVETAELTVLQAD